MRYGQTGSTTTVMESVSGTSDIDRMFTASGLIPRTSYTIEVAAVSSEGTGTFSTGTVVETSLSEGNRPSQICNVLTLTALHCATLQTLASYLTVNNLPTTVWWF